MAIPNALGNFFGESMKFLGPAAVVGGAYLGYRTRVSQGQNPLVAFALEGGVNAASLMVSGPTYLAHTLGVPGARALGAAAVHTYQHHQNTMRQMRTPFSHRFEHTEISARAQQLGLQAVGAAWGHSHMGVEAARFARRYGRPYE